MPSQEAVGLFISPRLNFSLYSKSRLLGGGSSGPSHPAVVGVALLGPKVSDRLRSSSVQVSVTMTSLRQYIF